MTKTHDIKDRFKTKVVADTHTGCWNWAAYRTPVGYGKFHVGGKALFAHRVSYELFVGPVPAGLCVCHRCDNRACVNPEHLFTGPQSANVADMIAKGRQAASRGESNGRAKLAPETIAEILRAEGFSQQELADAYGVSRSHISNIRSGRRWA